MGNLWTSFSISLCSQIITKNKNLSLKKKIKNSHLFKDFIYILYIYIFIYMSSTYMEKYSTSFGKWESKPHRYHIPPKRMTGIRMTITRIEMMCRNWSLYSYSLHNGNIDSEMVKWFHCFGKQFIGSSKSLTYSYHLSSYSNLNFTQNIAHKNLIGAALFIIIKLEIIQFTINW